MQLTGQSLEEMPVKIDMVNVQWTYLTVVSLLEGKVSVEAYDYSKAYQKGRRSHS